MVPDPAPHSPDAARLAPDLDPSVRGAAGSSTTLTVGDATSQAVAIAKDLLHLCATKVLLGQDDQIGDELSGLLGLNPMAARIVTDWATAAKGRALWLVGSHVAKVQTVRTSIDVALTNTNDAITAIPALEHGDAVAESGSDESGFAGAA